MPESIKDLPLEQLLTHLGERGASGTLTIEVPRAIKKLYLLDGLLAGVTSSNPRDLLGHFLVGWGLVSEAQVAEAMRLQEQLGTPLGRILERMGAIDPDSLHGALQAQGEEAVLDLFLAPRLEDQHWAENILPIDRPLALRRPLPPLVLEGLRRRARQGEIAKTLGPEPVIPELVGEPPWAILAPRERLILAAMDGRHTVEEVAMLCHLAPFHVAELAARGVQGGFIRVRAADVGPTAASLVGLLQRARQALQDGDLLTAWRAAASLREGNKGEDGRPEATEVLRSIEEQVRHLRAAGPLVPRLPSPRPALPAHLGAEAAFILSRVNGTWSLRAIQRITPLPELHFWVIVDALRKAGLLTLAAPPGSPRVPSAPAEG